MGYLHFRPNNDYEMLSLSVIENTKAKPHIVLNGDSISNLNSNYIYWADPDHLNRMGAIKFTLALKKKI
jgi:hypothetical protein